ncbi:hypothetical protein F4561_002188 [Lipingzhangella halophila]|uniref:Uncharacterized protein n=1 Tax=Lipingzhangella halophila TaxID=1783352 RepID=A0A7W7RG47_9ACTN|nr:hypothetical protein [Lipingzhangella halophila]MBB4931368.1 hypothetical protein [Lipingzhangella halophila]
MAVGVPSTGVSTVLVLCSRSCPNGPDPGSMRFHLKLTPEHGSELTPA